ncbi:MAG: T9SS type A sorting domain-containing protein [Saprospiraceae bacterium]|nr:T9SS type A sorting domain-containing protein [Saprospiraceae bacterium]
MRIRSVILLLFLTLSQIFGQKLKPAELVKSQTQFIQKSLFEQNNRSSIAIPKSIKSYELMDLDKVKVSELLHSGNQAIELTIPTQKRAAMKLKLVEIVMPEFSVTAAHSGEKIKYRKGKHYRGIVDGQEKSMVALSVFDNEVMGFIAEERSETILSIGKIEGAETHIIYDESQIDLTQKFECLVNDADFKEELRHDQLFDDNNDRALTDCVRMYFEIDKDIVDSKGTAGTTSYITGVFNQMATLYANENVKMSLGAIVMWTTPSPYTAGDASGMLSQFNSYRNGFDGDLGMLLSYKTSGGIAWVGGLCNSNKDFASGFVRINSTYNNVPAYSWTINGLSHEVGHLFGSPHTQKCAWNGNNTALDGCVNPEGTCPRPSNQGVSAFTIMSYCHLNGTVPNFNAGFGTQPGNLIRSKVTAASCLSACSGGGGGSNPSCTDGVKNGQETGIDCGGPTCAPCATCTDGVKNGQETGVDCGGPSCGPCSQTCSSNSLIFKFVGDLYPEEFTWNIKNSAGATVYSGGGYTQPLATYNTTMCLPNGCYTLQVFDTYGDGICCNYGNGSFAVTFNGQTLTNGASFTTSQTKQFCVNAAAGPTCSDGVKNGQETGIDCGGPTCSPCAVTPTCTDGVKNGSETGVDCGGPNCPACPTCSDGVKNGQETGVDCGGPSCGPCSATPTCSDGVKNGQETGVDCGGPSCGPCAVTPTCSDGIKNGQETGVDCGGPTCQPCAVTPTCVNGVVTLVLDNYPTETSWQITTTAGTVLYSGSNYTGPNSTKTINICLAASTCFNFKINDAYGDGMCCSYGNGSYKITFNGTNVLTGGQYGSTETKSFCVPAGSGTTPTCSDGVKNGQETGVDCGGPTCSPCAATPTCNDGVKNGQETGVDCGGPTCSPCAATPTCNDGVKNGQETGVDCGGPTCSPCAATPTCNDGVKNGQETGVDCGGPTCSPCAATPTCNDGVKNGQETGVDCGGPSCQPCNTSGNCVSGSVVLIMDSYPAETSWKITTLTGTVVYSGGNYTGANSTKTIDICLNPGVCYNFSITDAYGDGMCCSLGNGNYKVNFNGQTLITGGQFGATESKQFCVPGSSGGGGTPTPTCNDGVKNGQETGVDCGGPSCAPCGGGGPSCINATVTILTDSYPGETTWKITNSSGQELASGGPYNTSNQTQTKTVCLTPSQCYNFIINDGYGDGICCAQGNGNYKVVVNGNTMVSGGQFTATQTKQFCMPAASLEDNLLTSDLQYDLYPNPTADVINVTVRTINTPDAPITIEVFDLMGRMVKKTNRPIDHIMTIETDELNQGTYILRLRNDGEILYHSKFQVIK